MSWMCAAGMLERLLGNRDLVGGGVRASVPGPQFAG